MIIQLLNYIKKIFHLKPSGNKGKEKDTGKIILLILLTKIAGLVLLILLVYI